MRPLTLSVTALLLGCALGWSLHVWCEPVVYLSPDPPRSAPLLS